MTEQFDLQAMLAQAQEMQQKLMDAQQAAAAETVEGTAGGGMVRITANGSGEVTAVHIDPQAVDPNDVEMLEEKVLGALNDAIQKAEELAAKRMSALTGGMKIPGLM